MDKEDVVFTYDEYILLGHEKEWKFAICNNINGTRVYYAKSDRERQILYITYMWNLRNTQTSE